MSAFKVLTVLASVALALLPAAPAEHVHELDEPGHAHVVLHRHLNAHRLLDHPADTDHRAALDDHDGPVLTLTAIYNVVARADLNSPLCTAVAWIEPPASGRVYRPLADLQILIHGPPRAPTSLRAPPFSPSV